MIPALTTTLPQWLGILLIASGIFMELVHVTHGESRIQDGVEFGELTTLIATESVIRRIEIDVTNNNNLIYSERHAIKTTDRVTSHILAGLTNQAGYQEGRSTAARFRELLGFVQVNRTTIVVSDWGNHCLRAVDRMTLQTSPLVGMCRRYGYDDGALALFKYPVVFRDERRSDSLLIVDSGNSAIRAVDLLTRMVTTLLSVGLYSPIALAFHPSLDSIIISNVHYISNYNFNSGQLSTIAGGTAWGSYDGSRDRARFNYPKNLLYLTNDTILLADSGNGKLRLINTKLNSVSSMCQRSYSQRDGSIDSCRLLEPYALLRHGGLVYVGASGRLATISWAPAADVVTTTVSDTTAGTAATVARDATTAAATTTGGTKPTSAVNRVTSGQGRPTPRDSGTAGSQPGSGFGITTDLEEQTTPFDDSSTIPAQENRGIYTVAGALAALVVLGVILLALIRIFCGWCCCCWNTSDSSCFLGCGSLGCQDMTCNCCNTGGGPA